MFHLAIPSKNLKESKNFYESLGCSIGRENNTHIIVDFFGCQLVCHLSNIQEQYEIEPKMYPRHFGPVFKSEKELKDLWKRWEFAKFIFEDYFVRQKDKPEEHHTFFLKDPSNNIIEFKWYKNRSSILGI